MNRIMLVSSKPSDEVERCLLAAGCEVITVDDGEAALLRAQHATFDLAVIISTGKAMDVVETVFNLRDISPSMPIVIIVDRHGIEGGAPAQLIAHASPNTRSLTIDGLAAYLGVSEGSARGWIRNNRR